MVVVYGESGIGKSRLLGDFVGVVRSGGGDVLWGRCFEGGDAHAYGVWVEALRGLAERFGDDWLGELLGVDVRWLAPLLGAGGGVSAPAGVGRVRLGEVLAGVLGSLKAPVVVLDDMQWAFPESLELFAQVARLALGSLVVVSCRGSGLALEHPLAQRLAEVHRVRSCEYLGLGDLSRAEAETLLQEAAGSRLDGKLMDLVIEVCGGNPFFLGELGRALRRVEVAATVAGGGLVLPESVRGAVGLRLAGLSAQTRSVLLVASVFAGGFGFGELAALAEVEEGVLLDCLEQALGEELIRARGGERYEFSHALVRQALYERLSPARRARLHRRAAQILERMYADDLAWVAVELVRQYHASAALPGAEAGVAHALTAARVARDANAPGDAVMVLRLGLDLVGQDARLRARVLGELAVAEAEASLFDQAPSTLEAAIGLLEGEGASGGVVAELVYRVGVVFTSAVAFESLRAIEPLIDRALAAIGSQEGRLGGGEGPVSQGEWGPGDEDGGRRLAWARLKLLQRFARPETVGPVHVLRPAPLNPEAMRVARRHGTETDYALTIDAWDPTLRLGLEELVARIEGWRDRVARLRALTNIVGYLALADPGGSPDTERLCAELGALADDVGAAAHRTFARVFRAALLGAAGEFDAAAEQINQAGTLFESQPAAGSLVTLVRELTAQHTAVDWPRLAERMWALARDPQSAGWLGLACAALAAQAHASAGNSEQAREILGQILPELASSEPLEPTNVPAIGLAAAAIWELRASDLAEQLLPCALALANGGGPEFYLTSSELTVARLTTLTGNLDQAIRYFKRARETLAARDQPVLQAIVDYDEAQARAEHRQPGAHALFTAAMARFQQLGMHEWARRAQTQQTNGGLPDQLTHREGEILRYIANGKTNKQIATELVLSIHTVQRHIQNAYRKIGAHNRADASTYVHQHHLI